MANENSLKPKKTNKATKRKRDDSKVVSMQAKTSFSGPIPDPRTLKGYAEVDETAPKKIIDNFIAESDHRRSYEDKALEATKGDNRLRLILATIVCLAMIVFGAILAMTDHPVVGSLFAGTTLASVLGAYLRPSSNDDKQNDNDNDEYQDK